MSCVFFVYSSFKPTPPLSSLFFYLLNLHFLCLLCFCISCFSSRRHDPLPPPIQSSNLFVHVTKITATIVLLGILFLNSLSLLDIFITGTAKKTNYPPMCPARVRFLFPLDHTRISIIYLRFSFGVGRRPPLVVSSSETLFIEAPFPPKHNRYQIIRSHFF